MITQAQTLDANELELVSGGVTQGPNGETCTDPRPRQSDVENINLPEFVSIF